MTHVVFATPCLSYNVSTEWLHAHDDTLLLLQGMGIEQSWVQVSGDCYLARVRNRLVHKFLKEFPQATHLFFIDDDVGWEPAAVPRLLADDLDIVCGIYPYKQDKVSFPAVMTERDGKAVERDGLYLADRVPTGFLCIRRNVLEQVASVSRVFRYPEQDGTESWCPEIFRMGVYGDQWWGEDFDFCNRWREMGGEIWVDPNIEFSHSGRKTWKGKLMDVAKLVQREAAE